MKLKAACRWIVLSAVLPSSAVAGGASGPPEDGAMVCPRNSPAGAAAPPAAGGVTGPRRSTGSPADPGPAAPAPREPATSPAGGTIQPRTRVAPETAVV